MPEPWDEPEDEGPYDDLSISELYDREHERHYREQYEAGDGAGMEDPDMLWGKRCERCKAKLTDINREGPLCLRCDLNESDRPRVPFLISAVTVQGATHGFTFFDYEEALKKYAQLKAAGGYVSVGIYQNLFYWERQ